MAFPIVATTGMFRGDSVAPGTVVDLQGLITISAAAVAAANQQSAIAAAAAAVAATAANAVPTAAASARAAITAQVAAATQTLTATINSFQPSAQTAVTAAAVANTALAAAQAAQGTATVANTTANSAQALAAGAVAGMGAVSVGTLAPVFNNGNGSLTQTYLGASTYLTRPALNIPAGGAQLTGATRGWERNSTVLAVNANVDSKIAGGGMGAFYDFSYRKVYSGQDSSAATFENRSVVPVATAAPVASFSAVAALDLAGAALTLYKVTLATPLGAAAAGRITHPVRIQTSNRFFGYIAPPGLKNPDGTPLVVTDPAGGWFIVDNWTRAAPSPQGPNVLPSAYDVGPYTVTVDWVNLVEGISLYTKTDEASPTTDAYNIELTQVNNKLAPPVFNYADVLGDSYKVFGTVGGVVADDGLGCGVGGAYSVALSGWKRGFVAHNPNTGPTGTTYGFTNQSCDWGFYSTNTSGYLIASEPGAAGTRTFLVSVGGDMSANGSVSMLGNHTVGGGATINGTVGGAGMTIRNSNGPAIAVYDHGNGRSFFVGSENGAVYMGGAVDAGLYIGPNRVIGPKMAGWGGKGGTPFYGNYDYDAPNTLAALSARVCALETMLRQVHQLA